MARIRFVAALLAAGLGIAAVIYQANDVTGARAFASDFTQDWVAARALTRGEDPYQPTSTLILRELGSTSGHFEERAQPAPHPPILITAYRPLAELPFETARLLWLWLSAVVIAAASATVIRATGARLPIAILSGIGVLAVPVVQKELAYGQTNWLLLGLMVLGWVMLRRERDVPAGVALGIAGALKLFPLLMIVPVLRMGRTRAAAWMAGSAVAMTVVGILAVGIGPTERLITDIMPANTRYWSPAPMNLSLPGHAYRWLTVRDPHGYADEPIWVGGVHLPLLATIVAGLFFLVCVIASGRTRAHLTGDRFWETVPWMLLASPLSWEFSLVLLVPLGAFIVARAVREGGPPPIPVMLALALVVLGIPPGLPDPSTSSVVSALFGYGLPTYGLIVFAATGFPFTMKQGR